MVDPLEHQGVEKIDRSDRSDVHSHVSTAVATIFEFVKENGLIDIFIEGEPDSPIKQQLSNAFSQVRKLEQQIYQLSISEDAYESDDNEPRSNGNSLW